MNRSSRSRRRRPETETASTRSSGMGGDASGLNPPPHYLNDAINPDDFLPVDADDLYGKGQDSLKYYLCILCQLTFLILCICFIVVFFEQRFLNELNESAQNRNNYQFLKDVERKVDSTRGKSGDKHGFSKCNRMYKTLLVEMNHLRKYVKDVKFRNGHPVNETDGKIEEKIVKALDLYDADKIGLIDYALESNGGTVTSTPNTTPYPTKISYGIMGVVSFFSTSNPRLLIQPGSQPGQCFAFHGSVGRIRLRLAQQIKVAAVSLEHAPMSIVRDQTTAPKDVRVLGLWSEDAKNGEELVKLVYDIKGKSVQTFHVNEKLSRENIYEHLELHVVSNYGNPNVTCMYRFRVHGEPFLGK